MRTGWSGLVSRIQDGGWLESVEAVDSGHEDGGSYTHWRSQQGTMSMANELLSKGPQAGSYHVHCGGDTGQKEGGGVYHDQRSEKLTQKTSEIRDFGGKKIRDQRNEKYQRSENVTCANK